MADSRNTTNLPEIAHPRIAIGHAFTDTLGLVQAVRLTGRTLDDERERDAFEALANALEEKVTALQSLTENFGSTGHG